MMKQPYEQILHRPNDYVAIIKYLIHVIVLMLCLNGFLMYKIVTREQPKPSITIEAGQSGEGNTQAVENNS